jgi:hypothetical protein
MTAKPTWTYTPQTQFYNAAVLDETGEAIAAIIWQVESEEANQIAALIAAAPRLLVVCQMALAATCCEPTREQLTELWQAAADAYRAATECEVSE